MDSPLETFGVVPLSLGQPIEPLRDVWKLFVRSGACHVRVESSVFERLPGNGGFQVVGCGAPVTGSPDASKRSRKPLAWPASPSAVSRNNPAISGKPSTSFTGEERLQVFMRFRFSQRRHCRYGSSRCCARAAARGTVTVRRDRSSCHGLRARHTHALAFDPALSPFLRSSSLPLTEGCWQPKRHSRALPGPPWSHQ